MTPFRRQCCCEFKMNWKGGSAVTSLSKETICSNYWINQGCRTSCSLWYTGWAKSRYTVYYILYNYFWPTLYLLTAIGLTPGGSSTVHIYTHTAHRPIRNKQYTEQHKNFGRVRAVPSLRVITLAFALQLRKKARKNLSQGSRTIRIHRPNNKNTGPDL
jgi:hypothetical protein